MDPTTHYKQCPRCKQLAALAASQCAHCGRQFRTQFVPPPAGAQTQFSGGPPPAGPATGPAPIPPLSPVPPPASAPTPAHRAPAGAVATLIGLLVLVFLGIACWIAASHPRGSGTAAPVAASPVSPASGSMLSSGPFHETVTTTEQPEIRVLDQSVDDEPGTLIFTNETGPHILEVRKPSASISLPPGEYQWELRGPGYAHTGTSDQTGTLTCRRFRRYDLVMFTAEPGSEDNHPRLGDQ